MPETFLRYGARLCQIRRHMQLFPAPALIKNIRKKTADARRFYAKHLPTVLLKTTESKNFVFTKIFQVLADLPQNRRLCASRLKYSKVASPKRKVYNFFIPIMKCEF